MAHDDDFDLENDDDRDEHVITDANQDKTPGWRRKLERDRDTAKTEAAALKRENAFLKAGINPEDGRAKWLVKGYDGELTAEAIKAAAVEAGLIAAEPQDEDLPADEQSAHQRISAASTSGRPTGSFDFDSAIAEAKSAGNQLRVIQLKQAQSAAARAGR